MPGVGLVACTAAVFQASRVRGNARGERTGRPGEGEGEQPRASAMHEAALNRRMRRETAAHSLHPERRSQ